jgi:hypothetical protein
MSEKQNCQVSLRKNDRRASTEDILKRKATQVSMFHSAYDYK